MTESADMLGTKIRRLQPLRVLVSGRDRRFVRVTSFLLSRRGYDVVHTSPAEAVKAAERLRADVVLLEANARVTAARYVAALQALAAAPSVLLLVESDHGRWDGLPTIRKWTPLDDLVDEIEAASSKRPAPVPDAEGRAL
jgi:CheY-like chemotaxis protein